MRRTVQEQRLWDEIAKDMLQLCWARTKKVEGCVRLAREISDAMLAERRRSMELQK